MRFDTIEDKALVYYLILVENKTGDITEKRHIEDCSKSNHRHQH